MYSDVNQLCFKNFLVESQEKIKKGRKNLKTRLKELEDEKKKLKLQFKNLKSSIKEEEMSIMKNLRKINNPYVFNSKYNNLIIIFSK